jgi:hypothetical protein
MTEKSYRVNRKHILSDFYAKRLSISELSVKYPTFSKDDIFDIIAQEGRKLMKGES